MYFERVAEIIINVTTEFLTGE